MGEVGVNWADTLSDIVHVVNILTVTSPDSSCVGLLGTPLSYQTLPSPRISLHKFGQLSADNTGITAQGGVRFISLKID